MIKYGVIVCAICIYSSEAAIAFRNPVSTLTTEYDTVVIVQGWPVTSYKVGETKIKQTSCPTPADNVWNLHGVWPVKSKGQSPAYCNDSAPYDPKALDAALLKRMESRWPVYDGQAPDNSAFWNTQWRKHGTCTSKTPSLQGLANYFAKSLDLLDKYNVAPIFNSAKMQPGGSFEPSKIVEAVKKFFKVEPVLTCVNLEGSDKSQYLYEIYLCADVNLDLKACGASIKNKCIMDKPAVFPKC